jgi:hypothetical protein
LLTALEVNIYTLVPYLLVSFLLVMSILQEFLQRYIDGCHKSEQRDIDLVLKLLQPRPGKIHDRRRVRQRSPGLNTSRAGGRAGGSTPHAKGRVAKATTRMGDRTSTE